MVRKLGGDVDRAAVGRINPDAPRVQMQLAADPAGQERLGPAIFCVTDDRVQFAVNGELFEIDPWITHNLYYQYTLPWDEDMTISLAVENVLDEDPPFTQQQLSYDPMFANPLGRTFEIGLRKLF